MNWKKNLAILTTALTMSCATVRIVNIETVIQKKNTYEIELIKLDSNEDGEYDTGILKIKQHATGDEWTEMYLDRDFDGKLDAVAFDDRDDEGNQWKTDGFYDLTLDFKERYKSATGRLPTEEEREINGFFELLLQMNWGPSQ